MHWVYLLAAAVLEIGWAIGFKLSETFTRPWVTTWTVAAMIGSFALLLIAVQKIPIGTAYAVWTGIGAAGTAALGMWLFHEPATWQRGLFIALILAGVVGLKLSSGQSATTP